MPRRRMTPTLTQPKLLDRMRETIRARHYSRRTEAKSGPSGIAVSIRAGSAVHRGERVVRGATIRRPAACDESLTDPTVGMAVCSERSNQYWLGGKLGQTAAREDCPGRRSEEGL